MDGRVIWLLCAGVAVLAVLVLSRNAEEEASPAKATAARERAAMEAPIQTIQEEATPIGNAELTVPQPLPAPEISPELRVLLTKLRGTFASSRSKPNRIRLQRQLSDLWGDDPPVDVLLFESSDPEAPADYRAHFAARLRNLGKIVSLGEREELADAMRASLARQPQGNPQLAQTLLAFDDRTANIRAVSAPLESSPPDETTAGLLAALAQSGSTESRRIRLEHTRLISHEPDRYPLALQTALPPLALRPELEVEPILQRVLATTTRYPLYETAVQSCFHRPPGSASIAALQVALARRAEFDSRQQEQLTQQLRAGLLHWNGQIDPSQPATRADIETLLNQLP